MPIMTGPNTKRRLVKSASASAGTKNTGTTFIYGRFQDPYVDPFDRDLIQKALETKRRVVVIIGTSLASACVNEPMDYATRAMMIQAISPRIQVVRLTDVPSESFWSQDLDAIVAAHHVCRGPISIKFCRQRAAGLRYCGMHQKSCTGHEPKPGRVKVSAEAIKPENAAAFRRGMICAAQRQFPTSYQCVDIIVRNGEKSQILLGRRKNETKWRLPGGFVDPTDVSLEAAALREAGEELSKNPDEVDFGGTDSFEYLGSYRINDFRYRDSVHKVMTSLFATTFVFGKLEASDDLDEIGWYDHDQLLDVIMDAHRPLIERYLKWLEEKESAKTASASEGVKIFVSAKDVGSGNDDSVSARYPSQSSRYE